MSTEPKTEADIISAVRQMRKLVMTLDSLSLPVQLFQSNPELSKLLPKNLHHHIIDVAKDTHICLQKVERSQIYKDAARMFCEPGKGIYRG